MHLKEVETPEETMNVAVNKNEAEEKKGIKNPKSILKKKAVRFKEIKRIPISAE